MKNIGTLRCKLFGHIFIGNYQTIEGDKVVTILKNTTHCTRCGITREELTDKK